MLVIHIGPRKTATTYLQSNFYRNRKELLKKGWLYPVISLTARNAHHSIVSKLAEIKSGRGALVQSIEKVGRSAASKGANILISSENFRKWKASDFALLGERFGQSDITIVYTLRDPLDLLLSVWGETVKNGRAVPLADYAAKHLAAPLKSPVLNCLQQLEPVIARPELRLMVLNFEELKRSGADIYSAFGQYVLGLDDLRPVQEKRRNLSFSPEINDFLRLIAREIAYDPKHADQLFSRQFSRTHSVAEMERITSTIRRVGQDAARTLTFSRDEPWYERLGEEIGTVLGGALVPSSTTERLFPGGVLESVSYDIDTLAVLPEIRALVDRSLPKVRQAKLRWGRSGIVGAWRYLRRLFSV
ncbi:MAG: hypothetical protein JWM58_1346 [Rhizobium sp.]|nr:hypothetical protein [Rhizobium sp.]